MQNPKRQGKPQQQRKQSQSQSKKVHIFNLVSEVPSGVYTSRQLSRQDWLPFGLKNDFPQQLIDLQKGSAVHGSIIKNKVVFACGQGVKAHSDNETQLEEAKQWMSAINAKDESIEDVLKKAITDFIAHGNSTYIVLKHEATNTLNIEHLDWSHVRLAKPDQSGAVTGCYVCADWSAVKGKRFKEGNKDGVSFYPYGKKNAQPMQIGGIEYSVYVHHIKNYFPGYKFNGLPDYIGGIDDIRLSEAITTFNLSRVKNGYNASSLIHLNTSLDEDSAKQLKKDLESSNTGENQAGKIQLIVTEGENTFTVEKLDHITEGTFTEQTEITNQNIVSAHGWDMSLMSGLKTAGALGNTQEKRAAYEIINNTIIPNYTAPQLRFLNEMIEKKGYDSVNISLQQLEPLSLRANVDPNTIMRENEKRVLFGLDIIDKPKADAGSLNGAQVTSMLQVVQSVAAGQVPSETAKQMLIAAFGLTEQEADDMLEPMETFIPQEDK
tara:strand:- start:13194 stop:14672 length:1479 start_codon:yes stop_codon:yes gene_type:complete